jgi:chaperonin cofactor prefoldin
LIRSGDNVHQLDVGKLEQKVETLMLKVSTLERQEKKVTICDLESVLSMLYKFFI